MKLLISITLLFVLQAQEPKIDVNLLRNDTTLLKYKKIQKELSDGLLYKKYKLPANYAEIRKTVSYKPSKELMISSLRDAGMDNAEEYVGKIFEQTKLMFEFLTKHPELKKLDSKTKFDIIGKLLAP